MKIDLIHCIPEKLVETASTKDLTETVLNKKTFEAREAEVLDYLYRQKLITLVRRAKRGEKSVEELHAFAEHLDRSTHPARLKKLAHLDKPYGARWMAYLDILQSRMAAMGSDVPHQLLKRKHIKEILDVVIESGRAEQKQIREQFKLKAPNLKRILNMMEAAELIEIRTQGRSNIIFPGANISAFRDEMDAEQTKTPHRWARVLRIDKAA